MSSIPRAFPQIPGLPWISGFFEWLDRDVEKQPRRVEPRMPQPSFTPIFVRPVRARSAQFDQGDIAEIDVGRMMRAAQVEPELSPLEWDGDQAAANDDRISVAAGEDAACDWDPQRRRIRERYLGARFPGVVRSMADLQQGAEVIKSARLFFEDGRAELALELLETAIQENPADAAVWLARLEILFLLRDGAAFTAVARDFRLVHADHEAWSEVERLGRALAPGEPLFGAVTAARAHEHYGPWPDLPNWIQAPWDLTAEVMASDFHRAVRGLAAAA